MIRRTAVFAFSLSLLLFVSAVARASNVASCDSTYHWVYVSGAKSLDGTATGFQYICQNGSPSGPLVIFLDGGGGCWDGVTCDCQPDAYGNCQGPNSAILDDHFDVLESFDGQRWGQEQTPNNNLPLMGQTAAFAGPTSPFGASFNFVIIPYSTGDAFMGNIVQHYTTPDGRKITAYHMGYHNVTLDLQIVQQLFPNPSKLIVWGDSGGGVGADCNLSKFRSLWPPVRMWEMNNAGAAYGTDNLMPLLSTVARTWGVWQFNGKNLVENTCPISATPGSTQWNVEWVIRSNAAALPDVKKAFTDDYSDAIVQFFACLLGANADPDGTCDMAVSNTLKDEFNDVISNASNYKIYYHSGSCHIEREQDGNTVTGGSDPSCDFDNMQQNGVYFRDWVNAWVNNSPAWINIQ